MAYEWIDRGVRKLLKDFSKGNIWRIHPVKTITCSCVNFASRQAKTECTNCLGTGHKIVISKISGVRYNRTGNFSAGGNGASVMEKYNMAVFFFDDKYKVEKDDLILDENQAFIVSRMDRKTSANGRGAYRDCEVQLVKSGGDFILNQARKIVGNLWT